jgi:hypothetical protein
MDSEKISDNPWSVDNDWYFVKITKSYFGKDTDGQDYWHVTYNIFEPDSKFHGRPLRERFEVYPDASEENPLTAEQLTSLEKLKQRMKKGYGLSEAEVAEYSRKMEDLVGHTLYVKVKNNPGKVGTDNEGETFANVVGARKEMPGQKSNSVAQLNGLL